ncbi:MAG: flagellar hook-basal body complex protein FliE, partial [Phycisphaerae bacterium]|nr:flagellar hook-basal body complex protein FliE [Phycisphaerae bacterium]
MLDRIQPGLSPSAVAGNASAPAKPAAGASFADILKNTIEEVARLQQDASQATPDLLTGRTE